MHRGAVDPQHGPPAVHVRDHCRRTGGSTKIWYSRVPAAGYFRLMAVSAPDLKAFLVATPFFGGLSDASLDLLISMLVERRFEVGATVVAEGEPGRSMYVVQSGELVVSKLGESGGMLHITRLGPGDFFGEM